ncbi:hypothetical protein DRE_05168 [Drechslerella stenobrocha 248]|uniref:Ribonucleases P/MRP subunit Pop8-like domain-containing protein n=1 Tax=Drechslerella stenobrocha 248 TaxID=1043628 RepID=W7HZH0_9PEZI|nr:hypothetical protein DRE_05168 [Drechslerella stenobrocha 248]
MNSPAALDDNAKHQPRRKSGSKPKGSPEHRFTLRGPEWHYLHLQMTFDPPHPAAFTSPSYPPDPLTWKTRLDAALSIFLGVSGTSIPTDLLDLSGDKLLLRIPREDAPRYMAAIGGWADTVEGRTVGFRILNNSDFLMSVVIAGDSASLFR